MNAQSIGALFKPLLAMSIVAASPFAEAQNALRYVGQALDTAYAGVRRQAIKELRIEMDFKVPMAANASYKFNDTAAKLATSPVRIKASDSMTTIEFPDSSDSTGCAVSCPKFEIEIQTDETGRPRAWNFRIEQFSTMLSSKSPGNAQCPVLDTAKGYYRYKKVYPSTPPKNAQEDIDRQNNEQRGVVFEYEVMACGSGVWTATPPFAAPSPAETRPLRPESSDAMAWLGEAGLPSQANFDPKSLSLLRQLELQMSLPVTLVLPYWVALTPDDGDDGLKRARLALPYLENIARYPRRLMSPLSDYDGYYDVLALLKGFPSAVDDFERSKQAWELAKRDASPGAVALLDRIKRKRMVIFGALASVLNGDARATRNLEGLSQMIADNAFLRSASKYAAMASVPLEALRNAEAKRIEVFNAAPWDFEAMKAVMTRPSLVEGQAAANELMRRKARELPSGQ